MAAKTKAERDVARLDAASANLSNSRISERLAEIKSQHEPLNGLLGEAMTERGRLYAAAFYVVVGRMPSKGETDV